MNDPSQRPLLADICEELSVLGRELREMVATRWELARMELLADLRSARRLVITWLVAIVMAITSLPLLAICLAEVLDGCGGIPSSVWLLIFAAGLLILAALGAYVAWRRFRRRFVGLQETLEELREDLLWVQEKSNTSLRRSPAESSRASDPPAPPRP
jgi:uncharacterized membrane protein YqjE